MTPVFRISLPKHAQRARRSSGSGKSYAGRGRFGSGLKEVQFLRTCADGAFIMPPLACSWRPARRSAGER